MKMKRTMVFAQVPAGTYEAVLRGLEAKSINTQDGPTDIVEWTFEVTDGEHKGDAVSGTTSMAWSEKSKAFAWAKALNGNKPWEQVDQDGDPDIGRLVGLTCFIEVAEKQSTTGTVRSKVEAVIVDPASLKKAQKLSF